MIARPLLWILEDEESARFVYSKILDLKYRVIYFETVATFRNALAGNEEKPLLVVADLRLPDESFLTFLANEASSITTRFPFIIISSIDDLDILRLCFDEGASDFLTKPFNSSELLVKIQRILQTKEPSDLFRLGHVQIDLSYRQLFDKSGQTVQLTPKELQIFSALQKSPNQILSRTEIVARVWGNVSVSSKALDVHLFSLRKKAQTLGVSIQFVQPDSFKILSNGMN